jgi:hypothetical protein
MGQQKPWAVGAALRGFYDDNYYTYPGTAALPRLHTWGFDISPSASYNLNRGQTVLGASYLYDFRWYADRPHLAPGQSRKGKGPRDDQSHQLNLKLSHAFNTRFSLDVKDSFVIAQEPAIIDPSISTTVPARSEGDNIRNQAGVQFTAALLEHFNVVLGYANTIYDYQQDAGDVLGGIGSRSAVLDRMEHQINIDGNYQILPKTTLSLGYTFLYTDYTSSDPIAVGIPGSIRDSKAHAVTIGAKQQINPQFVVAGKVGVEVTTYDSPLWKDEVGPYAEASATWGYAPGSALQVGLRHMRVPTDVRVLPNGKLNSDSEATSVFISVTHQIASKILINAMGQYQHSTFNGAGSGSSGDLADDLFYGGVTLTYQFTKNIAAEVGYTYDRLDSDLAFGGTPRSFYRNRVFVGTRLNY